MAKADKLYKDSPKVEKNADGKPGIKKPSKADGESMGTQGNPLPGAGDGMPVPTEQAHVEHQEMLERHASEARDMHKRHGKEHDKLLEKHSVSTDDKLSGTPAKEVKETK